MSSSLGRDVREGEEKSAQAQTLAHAHPEPYMRTDGFGQTDGQREGRKDGWTDGQMGGQMVR